MNKKLEEKIDTVKAMSIEELCEKYNCSPDKICMGDYIARETTDTVCPYKVILGFANFENSNVHDLGDLEVVFGRKLKENSFVLTDTHGNCIYNGLNLRNSKITNLKNLRKVYGTCSLNEDIQSLSNLEFLGSGLYLNRTTIKEIDANIKIDGLLNIENCQLESLGLLKRAKEINIATKTFKSFGDLEEVAKITITRECNRRVIYTFIQKYTKKAGKYINNSLVNMVEVN